MWVTSLLLVLAQATPAPPAAAPPARQACDESFTYTRPADLPPLSGAAVWVDEAHHNFHTENGRYCGFAKVLRAHGLEVRPSRKPFTAGSLRGKRLMVIANAADEATARLNESSEPWVLPNRSAFTSDEIEAMRRWVESGGRLLLIADHMPFPGCAAELGKAFGFSFFNGYAEIDDRDRWPSQFTKADGSLREHAVTAGIDSVATFTGSAFVAPADATPLMVFGSDHTVILASRSGRPYPEGDPRFSADGLVHGAVLELGRGKVAVLGEAAMFSAQTSSNGTKIGLQAEKAPNNIRFLLNLVQWLLDGSD